MIKYINYKCKIAMMSAIIFFYIFGCHNKEFEEHGTNKSAPKDNFEKKIIESDDKIPEIKVKIGKFYLLKGQNSIGAFKIVSYSEIRARYLWYYQPNPEEGLSGKHLKSGKGYLNLKQNSSKLTAENIFINCGDLKILWLPPLNIFPIPFGALIAETNKTQIKEIDFSNPDLIWLGKTFDIEGELLKNSTNKKLKGDSRGHW